MSTTIFNPLAGSSGGGGGGGYDYANEIHVDKGGNDSNAGTATAPKLTVTAALALAGMGDVIVVHPGTYSENISIPAGVSLVGPGASIVGDVVVGNGTYVKLYAIQGVTDALTKSDAGGSADVHLDRLSVPSGANGAQNTNASGRLSVVVDRVDVADGVAFGGAAGNAVGDLYIDAGEIEHTDNGSWAIARQVAGLTVARVGRIYDVGGFVVVGIFCDANRIVADVQEIDLSAGTAFTLGPSADVTLRCPHIIGTRSAAASGTMKLLDIPPIDSGSTAGDPNVLGVNGDFNQEYYDRPNNNWYRNTSMPYGSSWTLV